VHVQAGVSKVHIAAKTLRNAATASLIAPLYNIITCNTESTTA
jgi:hypothetical protein